MFGAGDVRIENVPDAHLIETTDALVRVTREIPTTLKTFFDNVTISGGPAPARAYIEELLPDVLQGRIEPGSVFDRVTDLDGVPDGYRAMNDREAIKVMVKP